MFAHDTVCKIRTQLSLNFVLESSCFNYLLVLLIIALNHVLLHSLLCTETTLILEAIRNQFHIFEKWSSKIAFCSFLILDVRIQCINLDQLLQAGMLINILWSQCIVQYIILFNIILFIVRQKKYFTFIYWKENLQYILSLLNRSMAHLTFQITA